MARSGFKRQLLVFGRTGDGKSTIATMLVDGNLDRPSFRFGSGLMPVTTACKESAGRENFVVDSIGLGEDRRTDKQVTDFIYEFLKTVGQRKYSHLLFVKEAGRFDGLDSEIWKIFLHVFKGSEKAMVVVFSVKDASLEPDEWIEANRQAIEEKYDLPVRNRYVGVRFPKPHSDSRIEEEYRLVRTLSLQQLEDYLDLVFRENSPDGIFFEADFQKLPDGKLWEFAVRVWEFIKHAWSRVPKWLVDDLGRRAWTYCVNRFFNKR